MTGKVANMSNYPNGFGGGLVLDGLATHRTHSGKVYYVARGSDATLGTQPAYPNQKSASNGNNGSFLAPFQTLAYAVEQCVDNRGDVIICLPGLVEDIETAIDIEAGNVTIVGIGTGADRPQITPDIDAALDVEGDNVTVQNMYFNEATAERAANGSAVDVVGAHFRFLGNHVDLGAHDDNFLTVSAATSDFCTIEGNRFVVTANGTDAVIHLEAAADGLIFRDNVCIGSVAIPDSAWVDAEAVAITNALLEGNSYFSGTDFLGTAAVGTQNKDAAAQGQINALLCAASTDDDESVIADVTGTVNIWGIASFVETAMVVGSNYGVTADGNAVALVASTAEGADEQGVAGDLTYAAYGGAAPTEVEVGAVPATMASVIWPNPVQVTTGAIVLENTGAATGDWDHVIYWSPVSDNGLVADE